MLYLAVCMWLKICLYLAKWLRRDNVKFKTCKETLVFFFSLPPAHSLLVCSLLPVPARYSSQDWIHHSQALPHSHWTEPAHSAEPVLCLAEKSQNSSSERTPPPAPSSCSHHSLGPSRRPLQVWWQQQRAEQTQARISHGAHLGVLGIFFTSDETHRHQTLSYDGHSHLPFPRNQSPLNTGAISAPRLSPCPLWYEAAASWQGQRCRCCSVLFLLCKNA